MFTNRDSLVAQLVKNLAAMQEVTYNAGDLSSIPGSGRCPGEGNDNLVQYSCLENPMDRGAWKVRVYRVRKKYLEYYWCTVSVNQIYFILK